MPWHWGWTRVQARFQFDLLTLQMLKPRRGCIVVRIKHVNRHRGLRTALAVALSIRGSLLPQRPRHYCHYHQRLEAGEHPTGGSSPSPPGSDPHTPRRTESVHCTPSPRAVQQHEITQSHRARVLYPAPSSNHRPSAPKASTC